MKVKYKEAFTIIELVVIIAIIAILALLAMPKFMNYTREAEFTRLTYDARLLENACEQYYLNHGDWPRASDTPYTAEQVNAFAQKVYDQTGKVIVLDPEGKYYDIDMQKLGRYVTINSDPKNFILQNPVGSVYILDPQTNTKLQETKIVQKPVAVITMTPNQGLTTATKITWDYSQSYDPNGLEITNTEWEGKQDQYTTEGEYTVKLRVQNSKGVWSDWVSITFYVSDVAEVDLTAYTKVIYVSCNGDDLSGNGTKEHPYKTIPKAFSMATDNTCIYVIEEGVYSVPQGLQSILATDKTITYAVPSALRGKVKFSLEGTEYNINIRMNRLNSFIGIIFTLNGTGGWNRGRTYEYFFDSAVINLEFYNCVFASNGAIPSEFPIYTGNSAGCTIRKLDYINCSFVPNFSAYEGYGNIRNGNFINCAHKRAEFTTDPYNLTGVTFDANYNIISEGWQHTGTGTNPDGTQANIGVYGGKYAWEPKIN